MTDIESPQDAAFIVWTPNSEADDWLNDYSRSQGGFIVTRGGIKVRVDA